MTNSMQAALSKAAIYTKQPTREWGDPYLSWGCANVLLRLYESERSNVLLLNMYESLWVSVRVVESGSLIQVAEGVRVVWCSQNILWYIWELCESFLLLVQYSLNTSQNRQNMYMGLREVFIASLIFSEYVPKQTKHGHDQTTDMTKQTWPLPDV